MRLLSCESGARMDCDLTVGFAQGDRCAVTLSDPRVHRRSGMPRLLLQHLGGQVISDAGACGCL
jgi:hypothetical protein